MRTRLALLVWLAAAVLALVAWPVAAAGPRVYRVDVTGEITAGLATLVESALANAQKDPAARAFAVVVNTPGGEVEAARRVRDALLRSPLPTVAWVEGRATSAGALVTLAAERVYMEPGSTLGDAEPVPYSDKAVSYVRGLFEAAAQQRGRDLRVAAAMVDKAVGIPDVTTGKPLNLTWKQAQDLKISDGEARTLAEALRLAGYPEAEVVGYQPSLSEQAALFLTRPAVAVLLLLIGLVAGVVELLKPGVTLPGLVAILALSTFFASHYLIGTAGWLEIGLIGLGVLLLAIEVFVPGFGVFGVAGLIAMLAGVFLVAPTRQLAAWYAAISLVGLTVAGGFLVSFLSRRGLGSWLTLERKLETPAGFVPARTELQKLVGAEGTALTPLRPAGTAQFGQRRVDVVTEGEFVAGGSRVVVILVDGARVVVRAGE